MTDERTDDDGGARTLERWLAEEREVVARLDAGPGPGLARPEDIAGRSGFDVMRAMLEGTLPYAAIARTLETTEVELMHTVFPHPTVSETMHEAVLDAYGRAIHF